MTAELPYRAMPEPPADVSAGAVLARLVDGLAFRYRWATEGLRGDDLAFQPTPESLTLARLMTHVARLAGWVEKSVAAAQGESLVLFDTTDLEREELRSATLACYARVRERLEEIQDEVLERVEITGSRSNEPQPFWNMINGPLADALTHVGQINTYRRMSGNPTPRADVFRGRAPLDPELS